MVDRKSTVVLRVEAPITKWKEAAGSLVAVPNFGKNIRLVVEGDRILLQIEDWLPIAFLPISETRAVARYDRLAGT